jgi:hypothetical protein
MTDQPTNPVQASRDARHAYYRLHGGPNADHVEAERQADLAFNAALAVWPYPTDAEPRPIKDRKVS